MKNTFHYFLPIVGLLIFSACSDFLEEDITKDTVRLLAPADNIRSTQTTLNFLWEELEGATTYRLQVVSPSFDSIANLVLDEEVTEDTKYEATLPPGNYQWTVIGKNFGYETAQRMVFNLTIETDSARSLDGSILVLLAPSQEAVSGSATVAFSWQALLNADDYNFQLASPDFSNSAFIISNELLSGTSVTKTLNEGEYRWRVRGQNSSSISQFTERRLIIDLTPPEPPVLVSPLNGANVTMPVLLDWTSDPNSPLRDTLYVYKDSLATIQVLKQATIETSFNFSDISSDKYFWRVRTVDGAGSNSAYSAMRKFQVQ
ncbi:MAG: hypothetical protein IPN76_03330 [Saprospiraceae bacterium]|nr:hypothetical protein [Saprospiraceae bacterium]